ncbi:hypothetical protein C7K38_07795 [Tetragenococcus osmophilus]|uniref:DUF6440 domain-containing protein n=1 Tax=Tetragenococcus osmophilus TaxID=526944 RepID=A0AA38CYF4_9ENTE|nr:DUF6440 family protein [Tetragenococcus osmophilus]AYW48270.1 hypothetical protein C7K38_07795 [Tetragenococcus osmophilus]GMA54069.1 hypothetical protein GCM10025857_54260 [Alicyclobacillus contaminans]GMA72040.1 hypothetical protein GCM10025885_10890 [Tetragenococcus osmophilus]
MAEKRFEEVYKQGKLTAEKIIRDNETGVLYLVYQEGYGMGVTVMVDKDGKPLVDESFKEE